MGDPTDDKAASIAAFRSEVLSWYSSNRRSFPWRETRDPWAILVSEVMLQQTQTDRVVPRYLAFLEAFPQPKQLAEATVARLLGLWSGLGYNRRALALKRSAGELVARFGGQVPDAEADLLSLPGIGPYTARAVLAFAFDRPVTLLETNIRSVFIYRFFPGAEKVPDRELEPLIAAALDRGNPREWYYALMDYGVMIKKTTGNPNRRSAHYAKQGAFALSHRRVRGEILKALAASPRRSDDLQASLPFAQERVETALGELVAEGFLESGSRGTGAWYALAGHGDGDPSLADSDPGLADSVDPAIVSAASPSRTDSADPAPVANFPPAKPTG